VGEQVEMNHSPAVEWTAPPLGTSRHSARILHGHLEVGGDAGNNNCRQGRTRGAAYLA
jgi:hypothetical protein